MVDTLRGEQTELASGAGFKADVVLFERIFTKEHGVGDEGATPKRRTQQTNDLFPFPVRLEPFNGEGVYSMCV